MFGKEIKLFPPFSKFKYRVQWTPIEEKLPNLFVRRTPRLLSGMQASLKKAPEDIKSGRLHPEEAARSPRTSRTRSRTRAATFPPKETSPLTSFPLVSPFSNHSTVTLLEAGFTADIVAEWTRPGKTRKSSVPNNNNNNIVQNYALYNWPLEEGKKKKLIIQDFLTC